jgi:hypothetical protein
MQIIGGDIVAGLGTGECMNAYNNGSHSGNVSHGATAARLRPLVNQTANVKRPAYLGCKAHPVLQIHCQYAIRVQGRRKKERDR